MEKALREEKERAEADIQNEAEITEQQEARADLKKDYGDD